MLECFLTLAAIFAPLAMIGLAIEWCSRKKGVFHDNAAPADATALRRGDLSRR